MYFVIRKASDNQFYFVIKAANHEVVATSETYYTKQSAKKTISAIKNDINVDSFVLDATE